MLFFRFCCQDVGIILRNYHIRAPVVRDVEVNRTLAETEEIWVTSKNRRSCKDVTNTETVCFLVPHVAGLFKLAECKNLRDDATEKFKRLKQYNR